jgi:hypothetical protein
MEWMAKEFATFASQLVERFGDSEPGPALGLERTGTRGSPPAVPDSYNPMILERHLARVKRYLEQHPFESEEEQYDFLRSLKHVDDVPVLPPTSDVERAQDLMYEAWLASGADRVRLAREALEISADCADAYVLLAEETFETPDDA